MAEFIHIETKEIVRIMSDEGNFLTLNSGMKIDKQLFAQKYAPLSATNSMNAESFMNQRTNISVNPKKQEPIVNEQFINNSAAPVDPIDFLNSPGSLANVSGLDGLKKIDTSKHLDVPESQRTQIRDLSVESSAIQTIQGGQSLEAQKKALIDAHMARTQQGPGYVNEDDPNAVNAMIKGMQKPEPVVLLNENGLTEPQETMRQQQLELTGEDPYLEKIKKYRATKGYSIEPVRNPKIIQQQPVEVEQHNPTIKTPYVEDPTISIFKKFKRNHNITITLKIKDKISKPDFIKVMADGFEGDIIQFYSDEIFRAFLDDMKGIKSDIYNQIHKEVYGCLPSEMDNDEEVKAPVKASSAKTKNKGTLIVNNQQQTSEDVMILIPGKPTKAGKLTFKYVNEKGKIVDMIPETAESKGYKPSTK